MTGPASRFSNNSSSVVLKEGEGPPLKQASLYLFHHVIYPLCKNNYFSGYGQIVFLSKYIHGNYRSTLVLEVLFRN